MSPLTDLDDHQRAPKLTFGELSDRPGDLAHYGSGMQRRGEAAHNDAVVVAEGEA